MIARVLFVCMANQCRSPLAEAIARREFGDERLVFESAGLLSGGSPVPSAGLRVAHELGLELHEHVSRQCDTSLLGDFDLVLTMERQHSRELVAADPQLWPRVFTLKQFSRWVAGRQWPADERLGPWLTREAASRPRHELVGSDRADDVADPVASPPRVWRKLAEELHTHIRIIRDSLPPQSPTSGQDIHSLIR